MMLFQSGTEHRIYIAYLIECTIYLDRWTQNKYMKNRSNKTEYTYRDEITLDVGRINEDESFKYLGSVIYRTGSLE